MPDPLLGAVEAILEISARGSGAAKTGGEDCDRDNDATDARGGRHGR
jgi:hypothetical protein